jgi:hypothetical protein
MIILINLRKEVKNMKKRIVSIVLLVVLVLSLAFTVTAACDHTYMLIYTEIGPYQYHDDEQCVRDYIEHKTCTKCHDNIEVPGSILSDHSFAAPVYVGTLASGMEWWYHDCINCGARIDFYE